MELDQARLTIVDGVPVVELVQQDRVRRKRSARRTEEQHRKGRVSVGSAGQAPNLVDERGAKGGVGADCGGGQNRDRSEPGTHLQLTGLGMCVAFDENFLVVNSSTTAFGLLGRGRGKR